MGLNLSNEQIAQELEIDPDDAQAMATRLRDGIVERKPEVKLSGEVECDEQKRLPLYLGFFEFVGRTSGSTLESRMSHLLLIGRPQGGTGLNLGEVIAISVDMGEARDALFRTMFARNRRKADDSHRSCLATSSVPGQRPDGEVSRSGEDLRSLAGPSGKDTNRLGQVGRDHDAPQGFA
jgi:hypothetical protein